MRLAVASGKGGTGKTTVSTNLARMLSRNHPVQYVDCDVEEPNGHLFLNPLISETIKTESLVPCIDESACTHCGECSTFCAYNAIAALGKTTLVFPELCHSCGGCRLVCSARAISEVSKDIGVVRIGTSGELKFADGTLNVGQAQSPPLIRELKKHIIEDHIAIIDAPPGTSCPVVTSLRNTDLVVMVAEPTPFGLNDLELAVDMVRELNIPFGVIINRCDMGDERVDIYCTEQSIPIWGRIPNDIRIAKNYSRGVMAVDVLPDIAVLFGEIADRILAEVDA
jgi:MinD superfamily P-loop ATPase